MAIHRIIQLNIYEIINNYIKKKNWNMISSWILVFELFDQNVYQGLIIINNINNNENKYYK